jgi:uncharacterized membrane protein HdeD (DUF308 family)
LPLIYRALLIIAPMIGAVVLTWWLGAYAFAFGVALLQVANPQGRSSGRHRAAGCVTTAGRRAVAR